MPSWYTRSATNEWGPLEPPFTIYRSAHDAALKFATTAPLHLSIAYTYRTYSVQHSAIKVHRHQGQRAVRSKQAPDATAA